MPVQPLATRGQSVGLPVRAFMFTLDQVAEMLAMELKNFRTSYVHYDRLSFGPRPLELLLARNIAPPGEKPEWRIAESEVIRWLRKKGFYVYDRAWVQAD